jgi:hypothetical protein
MAALQEGELAALATRSGFAASTIRSHHSFFGTLYQHLLKVANEELHPDGTRAPDVELGNVREFLRGYNLRPKADGADLHIDRVAHLYSVVRERPDLAASTLAFYVRRKCALVCFAVRLACLRRQCNAACLAPPVLPPPTDARSTTKARTKFSATSWQHRLRMLASVLHNHHSNLLHNNKPLPPWRIDFLNKKDGIWRRFYAIVDGVCKEATANGEVHAVTNCVFARQGFPP